VYIPIKATQLLKLTTLDARVTCNITT